jgi:hypothetical protein
MRHIIVFGCCLAVCAPALASPVLTFDPSGGGSAAHLNQSVGWEFDVMNPVTVIGLGWWDETGNGIPLAHMVGLWAPNGNLLASALIPAATAAPLDGQFRTVGIAAVMLAPDIGYIVGGQEFANDSERLACGDGGTCDGPLSVATDPRIAFFSGTFSHIGGFQRPDLETEAVDGLFGPSFSVVPVPEPATAGITALCLALLVCWPRIRSHRGITQSTAKPLLRILAWSTQLLLARGPLRYDLPLPDQSRGERDRNGYPHQDRPADGLSFLIVTASSFFHRSR